MATGKLYQPTVREFAYALWCTADAALIIKDMLAGRPQDPDRIFDFAYHFQQLESVLIGEDMSQRGGEIMEGWKDPDPLLFIEYDEE